MEIPAKKQLVIISIQVILFSYGKEHLNNIAEHFKIRITEYMIVKRINFGRNLL